eukprot:1870134-Prymnesium_polylepis.1
MPERIHVKPAAGRRGARTTDARVPPTARCVRCASPCTATRVSGLQPDQRRQRRELSLAPR